MYNLEYPPNARHDMLDIVSYVSTTLHNPIAAERLAALLIEAGERIQMFPYANPVHLPIRPLQHEYRKLLVQNYLMFYWVDEDKKQISAARVIYAGKNFPVLLK